jgi:hypothetical protein
MKLLIAIPVLLPMLVWAADTTTPLDVKLGLWESTTTSQMSGAPPIPDSTLKTLTPEQRARMEQMAKAREAMGPQKHTHQSCMTRETLAKATNFAHAENGHCTPTLLRSTPRAQDLRFTCGEAGMTSTGELHIEAADNEHVSGTSIVNSAGGGNNMNVRVSFTAHWIGADCSAMKK